LSQAHGPVGVVDDDESLRLSVRSLLASAGFRVALFPSAEAFLAARGQSEVSCLVLDVQLDGMSGLDLAEHIAALGVKLPFVVLTALDDKECERRSSQAGASAVLRKPFCPEELLGAVRSMLSGSSS
jgi:FixJ family two-component response regulator